MGRVAASCALGALLVVSHGGCVLLEARHDIQQLAQAAILSGEVHSPSGADKAVVVFLFQENGAGEPTVRSYYVRYGSGPFEFRPAAGPTYLFALADEDGDSRFSERDPSAWYGGASPVRIDAQPASERRGLDIELSYTEPEGAAKLRALAEAGPEGNPDLAAIHSGDLAELGDARFSTESGQMGLWRPVEFVREFGAGIYFLEPYDPGRVPVLFVHGAAGSPSQFREIIDGIDHDRFQPWVAHYPSGIRLGVVANFLRSVLDSTHSKYRFDKLVIVAHSMGGLVSRACINGIASRKDNDYVSALITLSTPWQGNASAEMGTRQSPVVVPSWFDMVPSSPFLRGLFDEPLPASLPHYLFFSFEGGTGTDGTVSLASQLAPQAQDGAFATYGFAADHAGILRSPALIRKLNAVLAASASAASASARARASRADPPRVRP